MYILVALCNRIHLQPNALRMRHILTQSQLVCHSFMCHETLFHCNCWRPYHVECTGSLLTSEVKRHRARLVLGWGTAWEDLRVLSAFAPVGPEFFDCCVFGVCSVSWGKGVAGGWKGRNVGLVCFLVFALMHVDGSPRPWPPSLSTSLVWRSNSTAPGGTC